MADLAELKQMVLSFRVSELHVLLGFAGRNKSGRKQELTQRALALVQKGCSLPVQIKIRELYRQIYPVAKNQNSPPSHKEVNMPVMHRHPGMVGYPAENPGKSYILLLSIVLKQREPKAEQRITVLFASTHVVQGFEVKLVVPSHSGS